MRPIPQKLRKQLSEDPFMEACCYPGCACKEVEWHHSVIYARKQVNEKWAILPLCHEHHNSKEGRDWAELLAITLMTEEDRIMYSKRDWLQRAKYLKLNI